MLTPAPSKESKTTKHRGHLCHKTALLKQAIERPETTWTNSKFIRTQRTNHISTKGTQNQNI